MGIDNVVTGHGLGIALVGMTVVFGGLALVTLYLMLLPRVIAWAGRAGRQATARIEAVEALIMEREAAGGIDPNILVAIAYVLQAERDREQTVDRQRITLRDTGEQRVWTAMGKMRSLATRM